MIHFISQKEYGILQKEKSKTTTENHHDKKQINIQIFYGKIHGVRPRSCYLSFAKERAALWRSFALWASFEIGSIDKDQFEIIWKDKVAQLTTYQFNRNHTKCQQGRKEHISLKSTLQTDISRELSETTAASHTSSEQL